MAEQLPGDGSVRETARIGCLAIAGLSVTGAVVLVLIEGAGILHGDANATNPGRSPSPTILDPSLTDTGLPDFVDPADGTSPETAPAPALDGSCEPRHADQLRWFCITAGGKILEVTITNYDDNTRILGIDGVSRADIDVDDKTLTFQGVDPAGECDLVLLGLDQPDPTASVNCPS